MRTAADLAEVTLGRPAAGVGTGGMATKVEAAPSPPRPGVPVVVTSAAQAAAALAGEPGRHAVRAPPGRRPSARLLWLRHASRPRGRLILDDGAVAPSSTGDASLLPPASPASTGDFAAGDPVDLVGPAGAVVARGLVAYDAAELPGLLGRKTGDLAPEYRREVVHRDEMVLVAPLVA